MCQPVRRPSAYRIGARILGVVTLLLAAASCSPTPIPNAGTFIEEFEGFPIYHGTPGRPYRVLGPVYDAGAAARGVSPMKRAATATARRLGADAIVLGGVSDGVDPHTPSEVEPAVVAAPMKWQRAIAIKLE